MSHLIDISQAAAKLHELLALVKAGDEVILTDHDVPQAKLSLINESDKCPLGMHPGDFKMAPDFDDELPDDFWLGSDDDLVYN